MSAPGPTPTPIPTPTTPEPTGTRVVHLRSNGLSVVVETGGSGLPRIAYWGRDLGPASEEDLRDVVELSRQQPVRGYLDTPPEVPVVPEASRGFQGRPAVTGHRGARGWSTRFEVTDLRTTGDGEPAGETASVGRFGAGEVGDIDEGDPVVVGSVTFQAEDRAAGLDLTWTLEMLRGGVARQRARLRNTGQGVFDVDQVSLVAPVPARAVELLDFAGRWSKERVPQRSPFQVGSHVRESRRGRTGADAATVLLAGERDFTFDHGELWGVHVAWSGNHLTYAESLSSGERVLGGGELLTPGEVRLAEGDAYETPWIYLSWGDGLDDLAARFHQFLRARPTHPRTPRPVTLNVWQAVYFDQDRDTLTRLARLAARIGVERFVIDDGWFLGRRDDWRGLGDWYVDPDVWPGTSLADFAELVHSLGMQFGLWFEPEMINPDSDLYRAHPDWVLQPGVDGRLPLPARHQQVLNLAVPEAWEHIRGRIVSVVREVGVDYIKWDHNRDLVEAGDARTGRPLVHEQTAAVYRLLARVKAECPGLEIESCSSGGARVDLGILEHTDRVWPSDCIDAVERQDILRWTSQLLPLELLGTHIEAERSHTTGRHLPLELRAVTALFGHMGIEWDITEASEEDLRRLTEWIDLYKDQRDLLHTGRLVRQDVPWLGAQALGVVSQPDARRALWSLRVLERTGRSPTGTVAIPGLDADLHYLVRRVGPASDVDVPGGWFPAWWTDGQILSGRVLAQVGLAVPHLEVDSALVVLLEAVDPR